ncbi:MAG: siderophore ABC transporter substrate-binding protein [Thermomicrobiales bacterium]|nr:siderophore ABC transporter substrate-binding protein [Thermomicrobiales bacterium]
MHSHRSLTDRRAARRTVLRLAAVAIGTLAVGGPLRNLAVAAQDATPEATAAIHAVAGPGENEVTVTHAQGETVVPLNPEKVFSFDIASIDTLQALGIPVAGMPDLATGGERYASEGVVNIGSLFEPDYESVAAEQPDLIIVAARSAEALPELSKIAPTIDLTASGTSFLGDMAANARVLGEIFGKQAETEAALADIDEHVAALREQAADQGTALVIMSTGGSVTALAPGAATAGRGALIYETLGFTPPLADIESATHGEPISFEFLLEHNPDWLFVIDRDAAIGEEGGQPAEQVLDNEIMHQTTAWQNGQIVYLNPFDWYIITGAGLDSMQRMLGELDTALSGE